MRTTADHAGDRPEDWEAPGAALVRSAATAARESGKLVLRRAAALEDRRCVAVSGTHGRSRRHRCWWSRCRRALWTRPSPTESSSNDPSNQQAVTLTPYDTLIHSALTIPLGAVRRFR
jgi:hypothetical protein